MPSDDKDLDVLLATLPRHEAPAALKRDLRTRYASPAPPARRGMTFMVGAFASLAAAAIALLVLRPRASADSALETELTNDHLRMLYAEHPLDVESTGIHDVKPWFSGKIDFAPPVTFAGDQDFPLRGGSVAYVVDRKAAEFVFKRRLHTISLFVVPRAGLAWTEGSATIRGFHLVTWTRGDFGYALVSDVDPKDLAELRGRLEP